MTLFVHLQTVACNGILISDYVHMHLGDHKCLSFFLLLNAILLQPTKYSRLVADFNFFTEITRLRDKSLTAQMDDDPLPDDFYALNWSLPRI